jgi:hypothetical protein
MKSITWQPTNTGGGTAKRWLIGILCGVLLALAIAATIDRLNSGGTTSGSAAVQQAPSYVLPDVNEEKTYRQRQGAPAISDELVPPPVDEFRTYREQQAVNAGAGLVPPPVDEFRAYREQNAANAGAGLVLPTLEPANPQQGK